MAVVIDGKAVAREVRAEVKESVAAFVEKHGFAPTLAVVLIGENPASLVYVASKEKACKWVGLRSIAVRMPTETTEEEALKTISELNADPTVDGILVQLPLPKHINEERVLRAVSPDKDVDGFHPLNAGELTRSGAVLEPCTPSGCIRLIKSTGVDMKSMNAVVLGRSNVVGKPVAMMLLRENCTVTVCHSRTTDIAAHTKNADILISAIGRAGFVTGDMVKPGAVVIDVGISRMDDGSIRGDVDFESAEKVAGYITPVPGGVGPMTIAMLLKNTVIAAERLHA